MKHPIPLAELAPALRKFCDPSGPAPARMMAAKGLVPLGPNELVTVLYQLAHDPDAQIAAAATEKGVGLPENILGGALGGALDPRVLDFYGRRLGSNEALLQVVAMNHATADETVVHIAKHSSEILSEIVATNEQRLLQHPPIIEALYHNKKARMSTVNRAIELAVRHGIVLDGIAAYKEVAAAIQGELITEELGPTPADEVFNRTMALGDILQLETGGDDELIDQADDESSVGQARESIQFMVGQMSVSEKIRAATLGTTAHRALLIRDANKLVALAAIKAPQVNAGEVEAFTRNRALPEEVVRFITTNRDWTKSYRVKLNLVQNPKTPLPAAMSYLTHLRQNDLREVSRSKNVPQAVAQAARHQLRKRG